MRAAHAQKPLDLFFSYFYDACVQPETIDEIRSLGIVTVNWYCNASYQLHLAADLSPRYDWCLVPERFRLADYEALGARPVYCQMAANPSIYRPYDDPVDFDVTFVGQAYGDRPASIRHLLESGIDVRVWGPGWRELAEEKGHRLSTFTHEASRKARRALTLQGWAAIARRLSGAARGRLRRDGTAERVEVRLPGRMLGDPLDDVAMIRMFSRSRINLGFSAVGDTHASGQRVLQVRLRDFEVPMSGGFYMVEFMPELEEFYQVGKEIVCYRGRDDMVEKIRYYLAHEDEREKIRVAGWNRARRDHTWQERFRTVFERISAAGDRPDAR